MPARRTTAGLLAAGLVWAWCGLAQAQSIWELTPYRVRVYVAAAPEPALGDWVERRLCTVIAERADSVVGAAWILEAEPASPEWREIMLSSLADLAAEDLPEEALALEDDKLILLTVRSAGAAYQIRARELDLRTRLLNPAVTLAVRQRPLLPYEAFRAARMAFAPLAQIEQVEDQTVSLRVRAARLPVLDPGWTWFRPGDVLRPIMRFNDREGKPRQIQPLEWTFLTVQSAEGAEIVCQMHSGLRSPLSGRRRGRVEQLALAVIPPAGPTRLALRSRTDAEQPLAGYEIYAHPPDATATELVGQTDARGHITVGPHPRLVRVLLVKHGDAVLARLPLVPGLVPELTAIVPDDDQRLAAEGIVVGLQEQFVDLIARRGVLLTRARARLDEGKLEEAGSLLDELRGLGTHRQFTQRIRQLRERTVSKDIAVQKKITKLFDDTQQVVNRYLNQRDIDRLAADLTAARAGASGGASQ